MAFDWLKTILGEHYTEDIDRRVAEEVGKAFVSRADFNALNTEKKALAETVRQRDTQLADLQKATGDADTLKARIAQLQADNEAAGKAHAAEIKALRLDAAVDAALTGARAKNLTAARALLADFLKEAEVSEDGKVKGLDKAVSRLATEEGTAFLFEAAAPAASPAAPLQGAVPAVHTTGAAPMTLQQLRAMPAAQRHAFSVQNPELYKSLYNGGTT